MKIFVSGAAGFIGSHLCKKLIDEGHRVVAYDNLILGKTRFLAEVFAHPNFRFVQDDLRTDTGLRSHLDGCDVVYHLAANSDIAQGFRRAELDIDHGVRATHRLLTAAGEAGVKNLIFASTSAVYGEAALKPTPETYGPLTPISLYGAVKNACESLIYAYARELGLRAWVFRFANIVGANLTHGAIFDFINKLRATPEELRVLGDGSQRKSFVHVEDCLNAMACAFAQASGKINIFNLTGRGVSEVGFIAQEVCRQMSHDARIVFGQGDRGWKDDVPSPLMDGARLEALGWRPALDSGEAVRLAIAEALRGGV